ncbi:MAG: hypothetical protein ACI4QO_07880, partial [Clostridia bacterium]
DKLISSAIPKGEVLQVTGISQNNWGQVTYKGVTGWIAMSQVSEVKANTSVPIDGDEEEDEEEEEETVEPTETENATAELLDNGEPQSSFPMVALFIGLIIIVVIVAAVLIVVIVTKKK